MDIPTGQLDVPALRVLAFGSISLAAGSVVRLWLLRGRHDEQSRERRASLLVWWLLLLAIFGSAAVGPYGIALLFTLVTLYALTEFVPWVARDGGDRRIAGTAMALVPLQYLAIIHGYEPAGWLMLPVGSLLVIGSLQALRGHTDGFIRAVGGMYWGLIVFGFLPSLAARLADHPPGDAAAATGWYLYVMLLTPFSDIAQALVGRRWGRRRITPVVSPHKTWEGFIGGLILTGLASLLLAPCLTPWNWWSAIPRDSAAAMAATVNAFTAGALLCAVGFLGDIHVSAMKRDVGVKDSGDLLPGQGGMIDRIDSLTFTGTTFYLLVASWTAF